MGPRVSRERLLATRERILEAACACFSRNGFHETTIGDIREESGLSTGAIYGHFENKDAIVRAAADRALESLDAILEEARADSHPRRGVERLFEALSACAARPGERSLPSIRLEIRLWTAALHSPDLREIVRRWYRAVIPAIAELVLRVREAEGGPEGPPPELVARSIVAAIQGSLVQRAVDPDADLDLGPVVLGW